MSIRLRLAAVFTLAAVVLLSVGGYLYLRQLRVNLEHSLDRSLQLQATEIAADIAGGAAGELPRRIDNYSQILSPAGRVLRSSSGLQGDHLLDGRQLQKVAAGRIVRADDIVSLHAVDDVDRESVRIYAYRTTRSGLVVAVAARRDLIDGPVQSSTELLALLGSLVLVVVGPSSWLLARAALRPVERMRVQVAGLNPADTSAGVPVPRSGDEISRLGLTFNGLLGRVNSALERERAFVADAGHELRTPLTVLKGEFELAQRAGRSRDSLMETIRIGAEETDRLIRLTENLLGLAREQAVRQVPFDIGDVARAGASAVSSVAGERDVSIDVRDETGGIVHGDVDRIRQAIDNLLSNAVRYSPDGGPVIVRLSRDGSDAMIEVVDQGPGFPPSFLPIAFDRFTRADDARRRSDGGNGLGLAVVSAIMTAHGGAAAASNDPAGGARLTLRWRQPVE